MNTYEKYKDSGVEWIGEIPSHWELTRVKYSGKFLNGYPFKPEDWSDIGKPIIRIQTLTGTNTDTNKYEGILDDRYMVKRDDLLFSWSTTLGMYRWSGEDGWLNQHIFKVIPNELFNTDFYVFLFDPLTIFLESKSHGSTMTHLTKDNFGSNYIPLPPLTEQHQIVSFLDEKTSLIDDLIKKKEQKIGLLKEYRTSLINRVITKGLNPDCPMKDSGVEWIGEIPSHWDVRKLKYGVSHIVEKGQPSSSDVKISPENIESGTGRCLSLYSDYEGEGFEFHQGDVLLNKLRLYLKKIYLTTSDGYSMGEMIVLRPIDGLMNNKYLFNTLFHQGLIDLLDSQSNGVKLPRVSPDVIINTDVMYPPLPEQEQIVSFLDEKTGEIDRTIQSEKNKIELLKEYRQSLISSVITGKIKVVN